MAIATNPDVSRALITLIVAARDYMSDWETLDRVKIAADELGAIKGAVSQARAQRVC